jgi:Tol biopolymer transport system component
MSNFRRLFLIMFFMMILTSHHAASAVVGDVNGDNVIDGYDAVLILRYDVGLSILSPTQIASADTSGDSVVDGYDAVLILRCDVGLISCDFGPVVPQQDKIVFTSSRDGNNEIYIMNADGTNPTRLTNNSADDHSPALSANGLSVIFVSCPQGSCSLYKIGSNGAGSTSIITGLSTYAAANFSPDGTKIAVISGYGSYFSFANSDGSNNTRSTNFESYCAAAGCTYPVFTADGQYILFRDDCGGPYMNKSNIQGTIYSFCDDGRVPIHDHFYPSPDFSKIIYDTSTTLHIVNPDGTGDTNLNVTGSHPSYSPDGTKIVFLNAGDIYTMTPTGENITKLTDTGNNSQPAFQMYHPAVPQ